MCPMLPVSLDGSFMIVSSVFSSSLVYLRNKSWKPECVGSYNMGWRILVFYPEPEARDKI